MQRSLRCKVLLACLVLLLQANASAQDDERFEIGLRGNLTAASGEPANDISGYGVFARYRLNERWSIGVAYDRAEFDFEKPAAVLGLRQDASVDPIDALAKSSTLSAWMQRNYRREGSPYRWFWSVGLGSASVDVPDARGPLDGGGTFDVKTDAKRELILSLGAGVQRGFGKHWFVEGALRADQHFAKWELTDRVSGRKGEIDDYLALGLYVGFGYRF
jgi:hypothetical protein